ncbi:hypothetical protein GUJ93_ZPchr0010g8418 [Zizania palustris]|uniref:Uncharacterized protein n=1 Tax=Zizania palustris TaxID=103762 RepID=A0A8J6BKD6_ZIZPA|nr:hypothetical protein GUJ93_ZPchr0010g8418 [Zizania palustris]
MALAASSPASPFLPPAAEQEAAEGASHHVDHSLTGPNAWREGVTTATSSEREAPRPGPGGQTNNGDVLEAKPRRGGGAFERPASTPPPRKGHGGMTNAVAAAADYSNNPEKPGAPAEGGGGDGGVIHGPC